MLISGFISRIKDAQELFKNIHKELTGVGRVGCSMAGNQICKFIYLSKK
jgi:hypothetical protein